MKRSASLRDSPGGAVPSPVRFGDSAGMEDSSSSMHSPIGAASAGGPGTERSFSGGWAGTKRERAGGLDDLEKLLEAVGAAGPAMRPRRLLALLELERRAAGMRRGGQARRASEVLMAQVDPGVIARLSSANTAGGNFLFEPRTFSPAQHATPSASICGRGRCQSSDVLCSGDCNRGSGSRALTLVWMSVP